MDYHLFQAGGTADSRLAWYRTRNTWDVESGGRAEIIYVHVKAIAPIYDLWDVPAYVVLPEFLIRKRRIGGPGFLPKEPRQPLDPN